MGVTLSEHPAQNTSFNASNTVSVSAGSNVKGAGQIKSGYAAVTYQDTYICLLVSGDIVHPLFGDPPISVRALTNIELVRISDEEAIASGKASINGIARHAARCIGMSSLQRTADLLLSLADKLAPEWEGQARIELPLRQEILGRLLGMSSVHFNRTLQSLKKMGLLDIGRGCLTIFHRDQFERLAAG